jgi:hypothetical protein
MLGHNLDQLINEFFKVKVKEMVQDAQVVFDQIINVDNGR